MNVLRPLPFVLLAALLIPAASSAQCSPARAPLARVRVITIGSAADDSARLGSLLGACWGDGSLLRSAASLSSFPDSSVFRATLVDPSIETVWNSEIPVSMNDGSLWAGRGLSASASGGIAGGYKRFRFMLAPRVNVSQNEPFGILPSGRADRSAFASPWHSATQSADLPLRFGNASYTTVDAGESMLEARVSRAAIGVSAAAAWWGPGVRNAIVMSNNAGGVPRVYVRTGNPIDTRLGRLEGLWMIGQLLESPFFDRSSANDSRSLSAAAIALRVAADTGLRVGISRAVYDVASVGQLASHAADVFVRWDPRSAWDSTAGKGDQVTSLFARWVIPRAGLAAHAEWARITVPRSLRDLMVDPEEGQGYTLGVEWARALSATTTVRVQGEATSLEQQPLVANAELKGFYTSASVPQGYTMRGQSLGAAIGPGASSQFVGTTVFHGQYAVGVNFGRIRWEEDSYYRPPSQGGLLSYKAHDVSEFAGVSAKADWQWGQVELEATRTRRMNFLFQTGQPFFFQGDFDVGNNTLLLRATPHVARRR